MKRLVYFAVAALVAAGCTARPVGGADGWRSMARRDPRGRRERRELPVFQVLRARWDPPDLRDRRVWLVCKDLSARPE